VSKNSNLFYSTTIGNSKMAVKNYKSTYQTNRQTIHQIFDDLDKLKNFCREKLLPFDEADLYNRSSPVWNRYYNHTQKQLRTENRDRSSHEYQSRK
jgi:hypothetical protein